MQKTTKEVMSNKSLMLRIINLDRREDRWRRVSDQLGPLSPLFYKRMSAVDGQSIANPDTRAVSAGNVGCWLSHQKCFDSQVESNENWNLILEDDAKFHVQMSLNLVSDLVALCEQESIDVLQLGWIESLYRPFSARSALDFILAFRGRRLRKVQTTQQWRLVYGEFRAGSHAYLISLNGARKLLGSNIPVMLAADAYLGSLAQNHYQDSGLRFARLTRSLAGQHSREFANGNIDSDIN
jgi:glycosyl transferase family 25